jgi:hypothetical protein
MAYFALGVAAVVVVLGLIIVAAHRLLRAPGQYPRGCGR